VSTDPLVRVGPEVPGIRDVRLSRRESASATMRVEVVTMTDGWLVTLVAGTWLVIGLVLGLLMGRRGHGAWGWFVLGTLMGPFAVALAAESLRHPEGPRRMVEAGESWGGPVDVLVGVDGSPEADAAAVGVIRLFGSRLGRVTLAAIVPYDSGRAAESQALTNLRRAARHYEPGAADLQILSGLPADELVHLAREDGYDVLAVGSRGSGRTKALLGSTAIRLARGTAVPVLTFGSELHGRSGSGRATVAAVG
jgi:nucleotide-binding universal stress UspA family protein